MTDIIRKITLDQFDNTIALEMGLKVIELAKQRQHAIAVQVDRLNQTVFLHVCEGVCSDKHNWLRRKANTAKHFEDSTLYIKQDLQNRGKTLSDPYQLASQDYIAMGGAIPIFVKNAGMIGVITVSGLTDEADHQLIVEALRL